MSSAPLWPAPGQSQSGLLPGAAGDIEVLLSAPAGEVRGCALVCHPHPLFGGAMSNKVVYALASAALKAGLVTLRFNFRGVGASQGAHDRARGETDDTVMLARWLRERSGQPALLLAGFSFGAFVSLGAAAHVQPQALVSIAPPFGRYFDDAPAPPHPRCPWLVVHSRDDEVVSFDETSAVLRGYAPPPQQVIVDGAGHFFHGRLGDIQTALAPFLAQAFAGN